MPRYAVTTTLLGDVFRAEVPTLDDARGLVFVAAWDDADPYGLSTRITAAGGSVDLADGTRIDVVPVDPWADVTDRRG
jgi:hypothetical protein